ncbi:MAG: GNAT family N-acetyltransferase, partial [Deinococcus sp.]
LDLLAFVPGQPGRVETVLVLATMRAYWSPWLGAAGTGRALRELEGRAGGRAELDLLPAWEGPRPR